MTMRATETNETLDLRAPLGDVTRHWKMLVLNAVIAGAVMFGLTFLMPSWYRSTVVILPPEETEQLSTGLNIQRFLSRMPSLGALPSYYTPSDIYRAILASRTVHEAVIRRFGLMDEYRQKSMERTLVAFRPHVRVTLAPDGTIAVAVEDHSRERAAQVANSMIDELDRYNVERRNQQARRTRVFLEGRVTEIDSLARTSEATLRAYQETHHVVAPVDADMTSVAPLADLMAKKISLEVRLSVLRSYLREENEEITQVKSELDQLNRQLVSMPGIENQLARLTRDVRLYQQVYGLLSAQLEDARLREFMNTPTVTVLDPAVPSERRCAPVRRLWAAGAAALAALATALWLERPGRTARRRPSIGVA
jgi:tyrosine-protein kinase Etk/Wzc